MHLDRNASGWLISFELDCPPGIENPYFDVEVYDSGEVFVPVQL